MGQLREEIRNIILRWNVVTNMWQLSENLCLFSVTIYCIENVFTLENLLENFLA